MSYQMDNEPDPKSKCFTCREDLPVDGEQLCNFCFSTETYCRSCLTLVADLLVCKAHKQRADDDLHKRCACGVENCWRMCDGCERYICYAHSNIGANGWHICANCAKDRRLHQESIARIEEKVI
jgi:hypothetical protein